MGVHDGPRCLRQRQHFPGKSLVTQPPLPLLKKAPDAFLTLRLAAQLPGDAALMMGSCPLKQDEIEQTSSFCTAVQVIHSVSSDPAFRPPVPPEWPPPLRQLMERCWAFNAEDRCAAEPHVSVAWGWGCCASWSH